MNAHENDAAHEKHEYLAFALGDEQYAVDLLQVQEIRGYDTVTWIANAPDHIKGVIHLRGQIVPIFDLRIRFGQDNAPLSEQTVVIILNLAGIVVDSVSDVVEVAAGDMKETPNFASKLNTDYIAGIATVDDRMLTILDMAGFLIAEGLVANESAMTV